MLEYMGNLGHPIETKTITLEKLSKGGYIVLGTPTLTNEELNEVIGVCHHQREINANGKKICRVWKIVEKTWRNNGKDWRYC